MKFHSALLLVRSSVLLAAALATGCAPTEDKSGSSPLAASPATSGSDALVQGSSSGASASATPVPPTTPASPTPSPPAASPAAPTPGGESPLKPLSTECEAKRKDILALDQAIPLTFMELKRPADAINTDMIRCIELCRSFLGLKDCAGTTAVPEVEGILARVLIGRTSRYREELDAQKIPAEELSAKVMAYVEEAARFAKSAADRLPQGSRQRHLALTALMNSLSKLARYDEGREAGMKVLSDKPDAEIRKAVFSTICMDYLYQGRYEELVKFIREVVLKFADDPEYVVYNIRLFDGLTGAGDLEGMEELMHLIRAEYPTRIESTPAGVLRGQYEQWYYLANFWIGFVRMALGDTPGAKEHFELFIKEVDELQAKLAPEGKAIDKVLEIHRDFRAKHLLYYYSDYHLKTPQTELNLAEMWVTQKKLSLKESRGKVVALVFRRPGDVRAQSFLQEIDRLVKAREKDGLVGVTLGFLLGRGSAEEDAMMAQSMEEDLKKLEVSLPAGYDPDRKSQSIYGALFATVGTASFAVLNRKGEIAWWLADPRDMDRKIAVRVIERLLKEDAGTSGGTPQVPQAPQGPQESKKEAGKQ